MSFMTFNFLILKIIATETVTLELQVILYLSTHSISKSRDIHFFRSVFVFSLAKDYFQQNLSKRKMFVFCAIRKFVHSEAHHTLIKELKDLRNLHCHPDSPIDLHWRRDGFGIAWRIHRHWVRCSSCHAISCRTDSFC